MVSRTPVTRWLDRLVRAQYLRIVPVEFRHTFFLRVEVLGCRGGASAGFSFQCFSETWENQGTKSYFIPFYIKKVESCFNDNYFVLHCDIIMTIKHIKIPNITIMRCYFSITDILV